MIILKIFLNTKKLKKCVCVYMPLITQKTCYNIPAWLSELGEHNNNNLMAQSYLSLLPVT